MKESREGLLDEISTKIQSDKNLEIINTNEILTRYMPLNIFCTCLENNSLRFSKPRTWIEKYDVFEDLLSNVEYKKINQISKIEFCSVEPLTQNYYAQCWNIGSECEGMWKSHTGGLDNGIMIKIKLEKLIKLIVDSFYDEINEVDNIKFIKMQYENTKNIINSANIYLENVFEKDKNIEEYVDFFKFKRSEFSYEKEYRFLVYLTKNKNVRDKYKYIHNFKECIEEVVFSPMFDNSQYEFYKKKLIEDYDINENIISKSMMFDLDFHLKGTNLIKNRNN